MKSLSFRDVERLSTYLDGQLSGLESARLEKRLAADPELARTLAELREVRALLRQTPPRKARRNFTLTPSMAGLRPPVPRAVPALSWASAVSLLVFVCTLGTGLVGRVSFGASAPMLAAAPADGVGGGPAGTPAPELAMESQVVGEPTAWTYEEPAAEPSSQSDARNIQPPEAPKQPSLPAIPWAWVWAGLSGLLLFSALLVRWAGLRAFRRRNRPQ